MNSVGAILRGRIQTGDSANATYLASQLMAEIMAQDYQEPNDPPVTARLPDGSGVLILVVS